MASKREVPLASSFPLENNLTPRAKRREALQKRKEKKKKENEVRAEAAKRNRENEPAVSNTRSKSRLSTMAKPPPLEKKTRRKTVAEGSGNLSKKRKVEPPACVTTIEEEEKMKTLEKQRNQIQGLEKELQEVKVQLGEEIAMHGAAKRRLASESSRADELKKENEGLANEKTALSSALEEARLNIEELKREINLHEQTQRDLRNTILELKGNIRVFARVRPVLKGEDQNSKQPVFQFPLDDPERQKLTIFGEPKVSVDGSKSSTQSWDFKFDKVFRHSDGQQSVFSEVSHLIQSVLDGYRVCIFAYGQTGSGKTYTMDGDNSLGESGQGIIPRTVDHLFGVIGKQKEWSYEIKASFLEIYNETLRDLVSTSKKRDSNCSYEIRHLSESGETVIDGLTECQVNCPEDLEKMMEKARKARAVGATCSNEQSSRSHSVFMLTVTGKHTATGEQLRGVLNLVDLAGSERLASSKAEGQALKETQAINKSLSCLGDVIFALSSGSKHVPFRNSKLTYLLQNSLGGNSKTLMFVNLSPTNVNESLCSLRFGHKVNSCEIGTAKTSRPSKSKV